MRVVLQRVSRASVSVEGQTSAEIARGLVVLLGIEAADTEEDLEWLAGRVASLRLFPDGENAWAKSVVELPGEVLVVSQFTLHASARKGTKASWHRAAKPEIAVPLYEKFVARVQELLGRPVATGKFGAHMEVGLVNDGPVTLVLDSKVRE